ncbi:MAG: hypothetical protein ABFD96_06095 [Armatimonadia bacterium]
MIRRRFMTMLGLAPAAVMVKGNVTGGGTPYAGVAIGAAEAMYAGSPGPEWIKEAAETYHLDQARNRLKTLRFLREKGVRTDMEIYNAETFNVEIDGMRSWSAATKARVRARRQADFELRAAEAQEQRELALLVAPFLRKFL